MCPTRPPPPPRYRARKPRKGELSLVLHSTPSCLKARGSYLAHPTLPPTKLPPGGIGSELSYGRSQEPTSILVTMVLRPHLGALRDLLAPSHSLVLGPPGGAHEPALCPQPGGPDSSPAPTVPQSCPHTGAGPTGGPWQRCPALVTSPPPAPSLTCCGELSVTPPKWRRKERRLEEPQAGRRGCSVKTMNEQRPSAGLLRVAAPLWAELLEARPFAPGLQDWDPLPVQSAPTPERMLTRINSSFNVKTQKYPVPPSLPQPPAASSRSFPWHRRRAASRRRAFSVTGGTSLVVAPD